MASATGFFAPTDILALNTLLTLTGTDQWLIQSNNPTTSQDIVKGLNGTGDVSASQAINKTVRRTLVYECQKASGVLTLPKVGYVTSLGWHIDSLKVDYSVGWPKLTVTVHKHDGATGSHTTGDCRTYTTTLALPAGFGIPEKIDDLTTPTAVTKFELAAEVLDVVSLRSLSYGISATHLDEPGKTGDWHKGENRAGIETLDVEFIGIPDDGDLTIGTEWKKPSDSENDTNQSATNRRLSLTNDILKDA